ncbi:hypothetical protein BGZ65_006178 [Modicella reniformis]|uniref:Uncharacterized protein n=1 Tax=Modicella reniformis TaxID=1440133 RepID=A0A9P6MBR5_9FUNG|nr:hypothetical protein BGZ65_006178 [Modicella reniformis]
MGVGKSYISYFLAARAYAEGWSVLYIADAGVLDTQNQDESAMSVVEIFLAQNKDILTAKELNALVEDYNGNYNISIDAISVIFGTLLKEQERKVLLIVDEHGKLFEGKLPLPEKLKSLNPLQSFHCNRALFFQNIVKSYHSADKKHQFYMAQVETFFGKNSMAGSDWDFLDLGLIYRLIDPETKLTRSYILCPPAHNGLLEEFRSLPVLRELNRIKLGDFNGRQFESVLVLQLLCAKPIVLIATDLSGNNKNRISWDFTHCKEIGRSRLSGGPGQEKVL